jgi:predicted SAM-dependent methyltransferase
MKQFLLNLLSHNSLFYLKIDVHFLYLRMLNFIFFRTTKNIKLKASFLNIGCGVHGLNSEKWFNLDGWSAEGLDYQCDLRRNLPFEDSRFLGIYSEHFLEHLSSEEVKKFLNECFRILCPKGTLRLVVPDGELYLRNYFENRKWMLEQIEQRGWMVGF